MRRTLVLLLACAVGLLACDRGGTGGERPKFTREGGEAEQGAFLNLGKRAASEAPELR